MNELTITQAAEYLGISRQNLRHKLINDNLLPHKRIGEKWAKKYNTKEKLPFVITATEEQLQEAKRLLSNS